MTKIKRDENLTDENFYRRKFSDLRYKAVVTHELLYVAHYGSTVARQYMYNGNGFILTHTVVVMVHVHVAVWRCSAPRAWEIIHIVISLQYLSVTVTSIVHTAAHVCVFY